MSGYNSMEPVDYADTVNKVFTTRKPKKKISKRVHNVNKKVGKMGAQIGKASGILDGYGHNSDSEYEKMNNQDDTVMLYNVGGEIHADSQLVFAHEPVEMDDDFYYSRRWPSNQDPRRNNNTSSTTPYRTASDMYYHPSMRSQWPTSATPQPAVQGYHRDPLYPSGRHHHSDTRFSRHHQQSSTNGNSNNYYKNYPSDSDYPFDYDPPRTWSAAGENDRKFYSDGDYYVSSTNAQPAHLYPTGTPDYSDQYPSNYHGRKYSSREDLNKDYFSDYEQMTHSNVANRSSQNLDTGYHALSPEHYRTGSSLSVASSYVSQHSGSMHAAPTTTNSPTQQTPVAAKPAKNKISSSAANSATPIPHSTSSTGDLSSHTVSGEGTLDERENAFKRRATSPNLSYHHSRSRSNSQHLQQRKASSNTSTPSKPAKQKKLLFDSSESPSAFSLKTIVHKIRGKDGKKPPSGYGSPMGLATKQPSIIGEEAAEDDSDGRSADHSPVKHSRDPSLASHRTSHSAAHSTGSKSLAAMDAATIRSRNSQSRFSARALSRDPTKRSTSATPGPLPETAEDQTTAWAMMSGVATGAAASATSVGNYLWTSLAGDKGPLEFFFGEIPNKGEEIRREDSPVSKRGRSRSAHTVRSRSGSRPTSTRAESVSRASNASIHSGATITPEAADNASSTGSKFKERWKSFFVTTTYPRSPSPESMIAPTSSAPALASASVPPSLRSVSRASGLSRSRFSVRAPSIAPSIAGSEASARTLRAAPENEADPSTTLEEGPAARLVSHFVNASRSCARLSYILVPVDAIADAFPSLQSIVVVIELFLLLWLLYQLSILVETLAIAVKAFCMPVIMICRLMGLNK